MWVLIGEKIMKIYRFAYFVSGVCAYAAIIDARNGDAWWCLANAVLAGINLYIANKNDPSA